MSGDPAAPEPYLRLRETTLGYTGAAEDFANLTEIRIGWFGPSDPADPLNGDFWWAADFAVREANETRPAPPDSAVCPPSSAFRSLPIRLVARWAPDPWRAGVSLLARMVYDEQPLALLGSIDSASTHLAEQVVAKANLPLVSPLATDKTATLAGVSWMFACAPDDVAVARVLVGDVLAAFATITRQKGNSQMQDPACCRSLLAGDSTPESRASSLLHSASMQAPESDDSPSATENRQSKSENRKSHIVLLATTDHASRMAAREVTRELSRHGVAPEFRFDLPPGVANADESLQGTAAAHPAAVIVIADAADSARLTRAVRERLGEVPVFGGQTMGRTRFLELAGPAAEGVRFPLLFATDPSNQTAAAFTAHFAAERHHVPDYSAALAYDATRLLIEAIRRAGPNRALIREALVQLSPWSGIAGPITFDGTGQNLRSELCLGTVRNGAVVPLSPPTHSP